MSTLYPLSHRDYVLPSRPQILGEEQRLFYRQAIQQELKKQGVVLVAHYYTHPDIQALAEETGGSVADSLEMARFGASHPADTLLVAGVRFMGETAKILNPEKRVIMPSLAAECSLDLDCPAEAFQAFCDEHPDRTVVVYANTSAAVKARADWVVTSSIAVELVEYLDSLGEKILWAPDYHLGQYVQKQTGADVLSWTGTCIVHDEFKSQALQQMKALYPDAAILVHPEAPQAVIEMADAVGSTGQLIHAARTLPHKRMIVATDKGIFYRMQQVCPDKELIEAPTAGEGATCRSCAQCPWMALNTLESLYTALQGEQREQHEIQVVDEIRQQALRPLNRMLQFSAELRQNAAVATSA